MPVKDNCDQRMSDHVVLCVDHFVNPKPSPAVQGIDSTGESSSTHPSQNPTSNAYIDDSRMNSLVDEEQPLIQTLECRICQEEDNINNLEVPCACSGSLKFAHRKCVQRWCDEKGNIMCEICQQPYQPNYTAPPPHPEDTTIDISGLISGAPMDINDPRLMAMAAAERYILEAEYDEYADSNASGAAFCRSAALILMALILLRNALNLDTSDADDDASTFFSLFLLRAAGFLLPCYIMAWAISMLQRRRQGQEAALAASEVAFMLQAGQHQFTMALAPAVPPHQDPHQ
uniref:RING-CH-type domain-containing protein n=2 Tax=Kalanchoe fedtschenkoi TaxID=63787 RepID=A0A7N1A6X5_KALFE